MKMKIFSFAIVSLIMMSCLLTFLVSSNVEASEYLGVLCGNVQVGSQTANFKLVVTDMGGWHYILNGTSTNSSTTATAAVFGNAEIVGSNIIMTLHGSRIDADATSISTASVKIDLSTMSGIVRTISSDYNYSDGKFEPDAHISGNVTLIPCP